MMPEKDKSKIEDIKRHLYDVEDTVTHRHREGTLHPVSHQVSESWNEDIIKKEQVEAQIEKPRMSIFKKFFIFAVIFSLGALGFAFYKFSNSTVSVSNDKIDIAVLGNAFTKGGDVLPLQVKITNKNNASLQLVNLIVEYPRGADDNTGDIVRLPAEAIGTIAAGASITHDISVTLFGAEKSNRNITLSIEYHPEGSNAIFTKDFNYPVTISSAPLSLTVDAPTSTASDQMLSFKIIAALNTSLPEGSNIVQVTYPSNFVFDSAVPSPLIGNSVWSLSNLSPTSPVTILIKGKLVGQDNTEQDFHVYAGAPSPTNQSVVNVVYNSVMQPIMITKPFLEAHILINSQDLPTYSASSSDKISGQVTWINNLPTQVTNAQLILGFSGNAYDRTRVEPNDGFFDSSNNQIIWDKNSVSSLGSIEPGESGSVNFTFKPISFSGASVPVKNPQINLSVSIKGNQPSLGSTFTDVNNFVTKTIKILSDFQIATSASYTSGALPPKADTETKYTITWTLSNTVNTIVQAQARSVLPIYVNWVGTSNKNEDVSYNASTREVVWNIKTVNPNTGISSNREASFTLSIKPSLTQVGSVPQLMQGVSLTGQDSFTGEAVKSSGPSITTLLTSGNFVKGNERVIN